MIQTEFYLESEEKLTDCGIRLKKLHLKNNKKIILVLFNLRYNNKDKAFHNIHLINKHSINTSKRNKLVYRNTIHLLMVLKNKKNQKYRINLNKCNKLNNMNNNNKKKKKVLNLKVLICLNNKRK